MVFKLIRIALVEDDIHYMEHLISFIQQYERAKKTKIRISTFTDGLEIIDNYRGDFDIILMDIEMTYLDGIATAEKIRAIDSEVIIIFITNAPQYAISGYKVDALDYVLKPISYFSLSERLDRALLRMQKRIQQKFITINLAGGMKKIDISTILYIEVQNHDLIFYTQSESYQTPGTLKLLEDELKEYNFFRCHKGYLVNLEHINAVKNSDIFIDSHIIHVSRARKKEFIDSLNNYLNEASK